MLLLYVYVNVKTSVYTMVHIMWSILKQLIYCILDKGPILGNGKSSLPFDQTLVRNVWCSFPTQNLLQRTAFRPEDDVLVFLI